MMNYKHYDAPSNGTNTAPSSSDGPYPVYGTAVLVAVLAALAILLDIPPLVWHFRNRNIAAGSLVLWLFFLNIAIFINAILWPTDDISIWWTGSGLCDVEVYMFVGSWIGVVGAIACILRGLAKVLDTKNTVVTTSRNARRRKIAIELTACFGLPLLQMALYYIVQPIRYFIYGISGCIPAADNSWPSIVLVGLPPVLVCLVCAFYACLVLYRLYRYRVDFSRLLTASNTTRSRFLRLFLMSCTLIIGILPVAVYMFYYTSVHILETGTVTYSWSRVHGEDRWNSVLLVPMGGSVYPDRWCWIGAGFGVFAFFGTGSEAADMYRAWLRRIGFAYCMPCLFRDRRGSGNGSGNDSGTTSRKRSVGAASWTTSVRDRAKSVFSIKITTKIKVESSEPSPTSTRHTHNSSSSKSSSLWRRVFLLSPTSPSHTLTNDSMELPITHSPSPPHHQTLFTNPFDDRNRVREHDHSKESWATETLIGSPVSETRKESVLEVMQAQDPSLVEQRTGASSMRRARDEDEDSIMMSIRKLEFGV